MHAPTPAFSLDHAGLLETLAATDDLLLIQDLDGVCMGLVRDPLTRRIERRYVDAARRLAGHFYVLTNGEHIGSRGLNAIVEQAFEAPEHPREQGFYLPGLAGGGVQLQDRFGRVSHPGVTDAELAFLQGVPERAGAFLAGLLSAPPYAIGDDELERLVAASVLDNPVSPTVNLNTLHHRFLQRAALYRQLQREVEAFMGQLLQEATAAGLGDSFFVHYAPNLGRDDAGNERIRYAEGDHAGTTDFQFMLAGAVKEVGVLVILNHYYRQHTGSWPLGEHFNARQAPRGHEALLRLAREHFDPARLPHIVGVGDTVTSHPETVDGRTRWLRGGSDRGFLTLVQELGAAFDRPASVVYIDSSRGEVRRPGVDADLLRRCAERPDLDPWPAFAGISDRDDPLRLDVVFPGGHADYVAFFCELARRRSMRAR
ncbi:glucosylglycerol 3-phosphatase [Coralloluteibacterium stylophorae]|uniref:Glucosylglycerol 3-phosphatase n=1 Tax=Coralloluteibacterium stylophorae TaxID=1776034 RepID=A0A8J7VQ49_9GAMM|nr:glucosylglycerol 3-phosphatase [Coralloluteibacterium stylophorae]MBS7457316.1 glucosylglycerol 3-phosphatase [Coralloluteibacterium stylophorae]